MILDELEPSIDEHHRCELPASHILDYASAAPVENDSSNTQKHMLRLARPGSASPPPFSQLIHSVRLVVTLSNVAGPQLD